MYFKRSFGGLHQPYVPLNRGWFDSGVNLYLVEIALHYVTRTLFYYVQQRPDKWRFKYQFNLNDI